MAPMMSIDTSIGRHQFIAASSIAVALAVMGIKYAAYLMTDSVALLSDAMESIVNVVTAVAALVAIRISAQPPDRGHPFGHHKAEYFAAVLEGALIILAAGLIFKEAVDAILTPRALNQPVAGLLVNGVATAINAAWAFVLIRRGRALSSPAMEGDGKHLLSDVVTSIGVLIGLVLATLTGWSILDPLLAGLVALNILRIGYDLAVESMSQLMIRRPRPKSKRASVRRSAPMAKALCRHTISVPVRRGRRRSSNFTLSCRAQCRSRRPMPSATASRTRWRTSSPIPTW